MPIREYRCKDCGNNFENVEIEVKTGSVICPNCKSRNVEREFSPFSSPRSGGSSCDTTRRYT